jgi:hypothetical protein
MEKERKTRMDDIIIGAITGYSFDKIEPWVNSLDRSGFTGTKAMLCYNIHKSVAKELNDRGYKIFAMGETPDTLVYDKKNFNVVVERFFHLWYILRNFRSQYRYLITTDVKDVIFQNNPSVWLENNIKTSKINASSESIRFIDEEWGNHNLYASYGPEIYATHRDNVIVNAGVMSGDFDTMVDLFLNIYTWCNAAPAHSIPGGGGPDQAAYNILLNMKTYKDITNVAASEDGWAAQLGTTGPQIEKYHSKLVEPTPILIDDNICTSSGKPFTIVHQYDRVPQWKGIIERKYL